PSRGVGRRRAQFENGSAVVWTRAARGCAVEIAGRVEYQAGQGIAGVDHEIGAALEAAKNGFGPRAAGLGGFHQLENRATADHEAVGVGTQSAAAVDRGAIEIAFLVSNQIRGGKGSVVAAPEAVE